MLRNQELPDCIFHGYGGGRVLYKEENTIGKVFLYQNPTSYHFKLTDDENINVVRKGRKGKTW